MFTCQKVLTAVDDGTGWLSSIQNIKSLTINCIVVIFYLQKILFDTIHIFGTNLNSRTRGNYETSIRDNDSSMYSA